MHIIYEPRGRAKEYADLAVNDYVGCENACTYCIHPTTPILMYDGTVKPISEIHIDDDVIGIENRSRSRHRRYCKSVVTNKWTTRAIGYRITLADGREIICSGTHKWLTDRRWKSTIPQKGDNSRLTENNVILGLGVKLHPTANITDDYMRGYLSGIIRGDANLRIYHCRNKSKNFREETLYRFRLALKEKEAIDRTYGCLHHFGIETTYFHFPMKDREDGLWKNYLAIRTSKKEDYQTILNLIEWRKSLEYRRGFLAGIYDAEGSNYHRSGSCRISNADDEIIAFTKSSLDCFGFHYVVENVKYTTDKRMIRNIRIMGGVEERTRFFALCNLAITNLATLAGEALKSNRVKDNNRIINIECLNEPINFIDITTSTGNFIANGLVSHNCFAPSVMRHDRAAYHKTVQPRTEAVKKWFEKDCIELEKAGDKRRVHMNFVSDPYPEIEAELHLTRYCIETATKHGIGINILTKGKYDIVRPDFDVFKANGTHFGVTCAFYNDNKRKEWEPNASSVSERLCLLKQAHCMGIYTWVSMEPVVYPDEAMEFFKFAQGGGIVDLWKVGKLNYHPHSSEVDWVKFREDFKQTADAMGANYIIKKDLLLAQ